MKIQLVSQASVLIESADRIVWTDPWLFGTAFNDSWRLMPGAVFDERDYDRVTDLWISHEHPDHFHIPSLRAMPESFKQRVVVWFQENNSDKVPACLSELGFTDVRRMPHRKWLDWGEVTQAYCAQIGHMDSCLAVASQNSIVLNINDCEVTPFESRWLSADVGHIDVLLNQFSVAGYGGEENRELHLRDLADNIIRNIIDNHRDLAAEVTIPFASLVYFCQSDNFYINEYAKQPADVYRAMVEAGQRVVVLYPGDSWESGSSHDDRSALDRYATLYDQRDQWPVEESETVSLAKIVAAFSNRSDHFRAKYPGALLRLLKPVVCYIPDLNTTVCFRIADGTFAPADPDCRPHVVINSQPLHFTFCWPWGLQTLGVSARLILKANSDNWRRHRIAFALDNAEIYLRPSLFFTRSNIAWFRQRLRGGKTQLLHRLRIMRPTVRSVN